MKLAWLILRTKCRNGLNHARTFVQNNPYQAAMAFVVSLVFLASLYAFFYWLFDLLEGESSFGPMLVNRLLGMIFLAIFAMLIFSNIIITLSTTYLSSELDFLMSSPMNHASVFLVKTIESVLYSSWAFFFFSLPMFLAFAQVRHLPWGFYVTAPLFILPFILIPGALGATLTMLLAAFFPARKTRILIGVMGVLSIGVLILLVRFSGGGELLNAARTMRYDQVLAMMRAGSNPFLPSRWFGEGLIAASRGEIYASGWHWLTLSSTAMMALQICFWFVPGFYYRGWSLARESESARTAKASKARFFLLEPLLMPLSRPLRGLLRKDLLTFWRDPTQWSQFVLVFGLLTLYIVNMRHSVAFEFFDFWEHLVQYFNLGITAFVLSILTTRFVYPLPSLEGRQYWIVGLAPVSKTAIIWQKYILCLLACLFTAVSLVLLSNALLDVDASSSRLALMTTVFISFGLTSLAVGLGSSFATFQNDNPASIANSPGGTLNMVLSMLYVLAAIVLLAYPNYLRIRSPAYYGDSLGRIEWLCRGGFALLNLVVILLPMGIGLRRWERMEVR